MKGHHDTTPVDRLLTVQEKIRIKRAQMEREGVPLVEQETVIAGMAKEMLPILLEGDGGTEEEPLFGR